MWRGRRSIPEHSSEQKLLMFLSALQAQQVELQRQQATDSLKKGLAARPDKDELIERMAPTLEAWQHHMRTHH